MLETTSKLEGIVLHYAPMTVAERSRRSRVKAKPAMSSVVYLIYSDGRARGDGGRRRRRTRQSSRFLTRRCCRGSATDREGWRGRQRHKAVQQRAAAGAGLDVILPERHHRAGQSARFRSPAMLRASATGREGVARLRVGIHQGQHSGVARSQLLKEKDKYQLKKGQDHNPKWYYFVVDARGGS